MCIKIVERYCVCRCIYYSHAIDACPAYGRRGHSIKTQDVLVGSYCSRHKAYHVGRSVKDAKDLFKRSENFPVEDAKDLSKRSEDFAVEDAKNLSKRSEDFAVEDALDDQEHRLKGTIVETAIDSPLRDQVLAKFEKVYDTDEHFIPAGDLEQVLTGHAIQAELQRHDLEGLYSFVCQRAKKVFAILLVIRKLDALQNLFKEDLGDELLPVVDSALESLTDERLRAAFSGWDLDARKEFSEMQWTVLVPVFFEAEHLKLDDNARLPFIKTDGIASGGFGGVHRVEIHRDHEKFEKLGSPTSQKVGRWTSD